MADVAAVDLGTFGQEFGGRVVTADDADYDVVRAECVWNGDIDRRPWIIARVSCADDVAAVVRFARGAGREVVVRGGGYNFSGSCIAGDAVMIDLGGLCQVSVDPAACTARCGGGTRWAQLDAATQEHGLGVPGGFVSHTGRPWPDPRRRYGLADPQGWSQCRQYVVGGDRDGGRRDTAGVAGHAPGPLLGGPWRWGQLRDRDRVRVPAARGRTYRAAGAVVLGPGPSAGGLRADARPVSRSASKRPRHLPCRLRRPAGAFRRRTVPGHARLRRPARGSGEPPARTARRWPRP